MSQKKEQYIDKPPKTSKWTYVGHYAWIACTWVSHKEVGLSSLIRY